jgi:hypothetical protein
MFKYNVLSSLASACHDIAYAHTRLAFHFTNVANNLQIRANKAYKVHFRNEMKKYTEVTERLLSGSN